MATALTKDTLKAIRSDIDAALAAVAQRHNIALKTGHCSFTETNATMRLDIATKDESGAVLTKEAVNFGMYAETYGMDPNWLGQTFTANGDEFRLSGLATTRQKFPVQAVRVRDGKPFKFMVGGVKAAFARASHPDAAFSQTPVPAES
jgi:hypothetical protein